MNKIIIFSSLLSVSFGYSFNNSNINLNNRDKITNNLNVKSALTIKPSNSILKNTYEGTYKNKQKGTYKNAYYTKEYKTENQKIKNYKITSNKGREHKNIYQQPSKYFDSKKINNVYTYAENKENSVNSYLENAEAMYGIPHGLLGAIASIESKKNPWAINCNGRGRYFASHQESVNYVQGLKNRGITNISVGCMQIHLASHIRKFGNVSDMLDPKKSIEYAAKYLKSLHQMYGSWEMAVRRYHSPSKRHSDKYLSKVRRALGRSNI